MTTPKTRAQAARRRRKPHTMRDLALAVDRFEQLAAELGAPVKVSFGLVPRAKADALARPKPRKRPARSLVRLGYADYHGKPHYGGGGGLFSISAFGRAVLAELEASGGEG